MKQPYLLGKLLLALGLVVRRLSMPLSVMG